MKRVVPVALSRWIVTFSELPKEVSAPPVTMPGSVVRLWPVPMEKGGALTVIDELRGPSVPFQLSSRGVTA